MTEIRRMCQPCAALLQGAGISCEMAPSDGGMTGICPACKKRRLCFNWKVKKGTRGTLKKEGD